EVNRILEEINAGKNFWDVIKKPFLERELRRCDVKQVIARALEECGSYRKLVLYFNLKEKDYHRFMRFNHDQKLTPGS
ncbi:MAG: hypothetical protein GY940_39970, partial [bacterium]|nr:hypothetical protein [bacterium]